MTKLNKIADQLRKVADQLDRLALSDHINQDAIGAEELVALIKQKVNEGTEPGLLQKVADVLFDRYEVSRVRQLTDAQATELAEIIGVSASVKPDEEKR